MDKYDELIREIDSYRCSDDVELCSELISVANLKKALEYKFKALRELLDSLEIKCVSNDKFFRRVRIVRAKELCVTPYGQPIMTLEIQCGINNYIYVRISRFLNEINTLLISDKDVLEVIKKGENYLNQIFDEMMSCKDLLDNQEYRHLFFNSGMFQFLISYTNEGEVKLSPFRLSSVRNENNIGDVRWFSRKTINEVLKEKSEELYSKVPIEVSSLPVNIRNAVYEYFEYMKSSKLKFCNGEVK